MNKVLETLANGLAPIIESVIAENLATVLRKIKPAATRKETLISLYVPIDTQLEKFTKETKTKLDDAGIEALKTAIEIVAAEDGFTLPNLDSD